MARTLSQSQYVAARVRRAARKYTATHTHPCVNAPKCAARTQSAERAAVCGDTVTGHAFTPPEARVRRDRVRGIVAGAFAADDFDQLLADAEEE